MTDAEILTQVKFALGITSDFQDDTISQYIAEVSAFMVSAGVPDDVVTSNAAVGCIARGVADLWNYGSGNTKLSSYFVQRVQQLAAKQAQSGKDGFSPTITVLNLPNGYRLFITDVNGNKTVDIFHGQDGAAGQDGRNGVDGNDGANGKDGVSPTVAIAEIEGGHRLTITDASGERSVDVLDGTNGRDGNDGQDGQDGQDYVLTAQDKSEIADIVADNAKFGVPFDSLEWRNGERYNMNTGELESRAQSQTIGKFTLENAKYKVRDTVHGTLHYFDILEWDENGVFVGNRETNSLETFVEFCANPKHLYALNINDTRNVPSAIQLEKVAAVGGASISIILNGESWQQDNSNNVYADITTDIETAFPDATAATLHNYIDRCNVSVITDTAQSGSYTMPGLAGGAWFSLNYSNSHWYLKINNSNTLADVQSYFAENPTTLVFNGADETFYLQNKVDYTKSLAEENAALRLPTVTSADSGKFLRVSSAGAWIAESMSNAESGVF